MTDKATTLTLAAAWIYAAMLPDVIARARALGASETEEVWKRRNDALHAAMAEAVALWELARAQ